MDFYSMPTEEEVMMVREITLQERRINARASEEEVQQMAAEMRREIEEDHLKSLREAMQEYMRSLAARQPADQATETEPAPYQYTIF